MGFFNNEITVVEKPQNNKSNNIKIKPLNGHDAIREELDDNNGNHTLTVKKTCLSK